MAHFAKLDSSNLVERVDVVHNDVATDETTGINFLKNLHGSDTVWKQTSFNTFEGQHLLGGTPLRKNYAGIGYTYDASRDAFYQPQPHASWILNEDSCIWEAPVAKPDDGQNYIWNETTTSWDLVE